MNEFLWQELELSQFYCCSPLALNDPFDCSVDWSASLERALASTKMTDDRRIQLSNLRQALLREGPSDAGVCCFTWKPLDPLMWSHYADSHRGVCLSYEIPNDYFMNRYSPVADEDFFFVGADQVRYQNNPFCDWLIAGDLDFPHAGSVHENALTVLFTGKAPAWNYEEEYRIITRRPGKVTFEPGFLKKVAFGLGTPEQHRRRLKQLAKRANKDIVLREVRRSSDSDFGMMFHKIAY